MVEEAPGQLCPRSYRAPGRCRSRAVGRGRLPVAGSGEGRDCRYRENRDIASRRSDPVPRSEFEAGRGFGRGRHSGILVLAGVVMLVVPGPGIVVIAIGFVVLGTEYAWAAAALERTKRMAKTAGEVGQDGAAKAGQAAKSAGRSVGRRVRGSR